MIETDDRTNNILQIINESNIIANNTIDKLDTQTVQFNNIQNNLRKINKSISQSEKIISRMKSIFGLNYLYYNNDFVNNNVNNNVLKYQKTQTNIDYKEDTLSELHDSLLILKTKSIQIGHQLDSHNKILDNIESNVDNTTIKIKKQIINISKI